MSKWDVYYRRAAWAPYYERARKSLSQQDEEARQAAATMPATPGVKNAIMSGGSAALGALADLSDMGLRTRTGKGIEQFSGPLAESATTEGIAAANDVDLYSLSGWIGQMGFPDVTDAAKAVPLFAAAFTRSAPGALSEALPGIRQKLRWSDKARVAARDLKPKSGTRAYETFNQRLSEARQKMDLQDRLQVDAALPEGFNGQVFMTNDGAVGFALSKDGYISNLYKAPGSQHTGTMAAALTKARAAGAKNLDAFDTYLAKSYMSRGAVETGRSPWNPEYAPKPWDTEVYGTPDYVAMDVGGVIPEQKHSLIIGPRKQTPLPRFQAARGEPEAVKKMFTKARQQQLFDLVQAGTREGGERWYWMGGLLDKFIAELGPDLGVKRFDQMMNLNAALSPRSTVAQQIKRASVLYQRAMKGENIAPLAAKMFPEGYGHLATTTAHAPAVQRIVDTGQVGSSVDQPKITSYAANQQGNYRPLTSDAHNYQIIDGRSQSPTAAQYPYLESRQAAMAAEIGLDPAEWQSALWVGAKEITGVADARNLTSQWNQRIAATAEHLDIPEQEALVRFMHGDTMLYGAMAALFGGEIFRRAAGPSQQTQDRRARTAGYPGPRQY